MERRRNFTCPPRLLRSGIKSFLEKVLPKYSRSRCLTDFPGGVCDTPFLSPRGSPALDSNTIRIMIDARYGNVINGQWKAGRLPGQLSFVGRGRKTGEGERGRMKVPFLGRRPLERIDPPSILMVICNSINSPPPLEVRSYRLRFTWNLTFLYIYFFFFSEKLNFSVNRDKLG